MKINKIVVLIVCICELLILTTTHFALDFNIFYSLIIGLVVGFAGGKIYSSFCNYKGELRHRVNNS